MALTNARFVSRDAADLGETAAFDFITSFDAVHDQARPDLMLAGIARALRPGGTYLCVDFRASSTLADNFGHPLGPFFYAISCMHCMTVSLADGGMGLGTMWGEQKARDAARGRFRLGRARASTATSSTPTTSPVRTDGPEGHRGSAWTLRRNSKGAS